MTSTYLSYKPTPIPWLPQIPEHWELLRNKYILQEVIERSNSGIEDLLSVSQYTGVTLKKDKLENDDDLLTSAATLEGYKKVQKDDLVINIMLAWNGSLGVSPYDGITSPAYSVYRFNEKINPKYFHYLFRTKAMSSYFRSVSSGVIESRLRMYTIDFFKLYSFIPPLPEQTAIANYLDAKTDEINTFIAKKEKLIALLKEQKQAIINELLQDKEEGWERRKLKFVATIKGRIGFRGYTTEDLVPENQGALVLGASHIDNDGNIDLSEPVFLSWNKYYESPEIMVKENDLVIVQRGSTCGKVGLISQDLGDITINPSLVLLKKVKGVPQFMMYSIRMAVLTILGEISSTAIPMLSQNQIGNISIYFPSIEKQIESLIAINNATVNLNSAIQKVEKEIELVKELKQSLIAEVVTGKIKIT